VIGGYAVAYHGFPRATADMDVWVAVSAQNATRMVTALKEFGFDSPELSPELFSKGGQIVRMGMPPLRIEIWTTVSGVDFKTCWASRTKTLWDGVEVNIISLSELKRNKKAAGRHKDLNDLENLP